MERKPKAKEVVHNVNDSKSFLRFAMEIDEVTGEPKKDVDRKIIWKEEWKDRIENMYFKDSEGNPIVLFHGTSDIEYENHPAQSWNMFETEYSSEDGVFHFGTAYAANKTIERADELAEEDADSYSKHNQRVIPVLITMENPLRIPDQGFFTLLSPFDKLKVEDYYGASLIKSNKKRDIIHALITRGKDVKLSEKDDAAIMRVLAKYNNLSKAYLKDKGLAPESKLSNDDFIDFTKYIFHEFGYDGVVYKNVVEGKGADSVMVFDKEQVYSATTGEPLWVK